MTAALIGLAILLVIVLAGVPLAFAMALVGLGGLTFILGFEPAIGQLARVALDTVSEYTFSVLPLFLLMANFTARSGLAAELYAASYAFIGHRRGGLAMSTILACGGFSTVSGSSLATAATMAPIAMPEMRTRRYAPGLSAGSIAAGGTLGILIPPSIILVVYGNLTETDIGKLFIAGIIPGLIGVALYLAAVAFVTRMDPTAGPAGERSSWPERFAALRSVWGIALLFIAIIGGIYFGIFTPTEAAGIGAIIALLLALFRRTMTVKDIGEALVSVSITTAGLLFLVACSGIFATFITISGLPNAIVGFVTENNLPAYGVILVIMLVLLALGCVLEAFSMILLFVPILYPIIQQFGFDLIWFGIVMVVIVEVGLITPPVGLNVFVIRTVLPDVPLGTIFRGVIPFILADIVRLGLLIAFPALVLFLPELMK